MMQNSIELHGRGNQSKTSRGGSDLSSYQVDELRVSTEIHFPQLYVFSNENSDEETHPDKNGFHNHWGISPELGNRRAYSEGAYSPRPTSSMGSISFERPDKRQKKRRMSVPPGNNFKTKRRMSVPPGNNFKTEELENFFNNAPAAKKTHAPKYVCCGFSIFSLALFFILRESSEHTPIPALINIAIKETGRASSSSGYTWSFIASIDAAPVNQSICLIFNNLTIHFNSSHRDQNFTLACRNTDEFLPEKTQAFQTTSPTCNPSISNQKFITIIPNWKEPLSCTDSPTTAPPEPNPFLWINLGAVESYDRILVTAWSNSTYPPTERSIRIIGSTVTQGIIISEIWTWGELLNNNSFFFMQSPMDGPITFNPIPDALITPNPYSANNKHMLFFEASSAQSLSSYEETMPFIGGLISFAFLALVCLYRLLRVNDLSYHDQNDAQPTPSFRA